MKPRDVKCPHCGAKPGRRCIGRVEHVARWQYAERLTRAKRRARLALTLARHPERRRPCPTCRAPVGSPCKRPSGYTIPGGEIHAERRA